MHLKVVACDVLARELYWCAARARHAINVTLLPQGLHDNSDICRDLLQQQVDAATADRYDAIVLGYGLCNNSLVGLRAGPVPVIVPRAHDCITLLLGSKERYSRAFAEQPGTYWFSSGWLECYQKSGEPIEPRTNSGLGPMYKRAEYQELVAKYGEDNAKYLAEFMSAWETHYTRGVLIEFDFARHLGLQEQVRETCREKGWEFATVPGDLALIQAGLDGEWDDARFLRLDAGCAVRASFDDTILGTEPAACPSGQCPRGPEVTPCR
ncbi:MAG TPA: DUF1638 domain-containing protein [Phycisphaerae bacterium]|nr:DUF1638 domain-containing protein [Phycisphaerae bacterium]